MRGLSKRVFRSLCVYVFYWFVGYKEVHNRSEQTGSASAGPGLSVRQPENQREGSAAPGTEECGTRRVGSDVQCLLMVMVGEQSGGSLLDGAE